MIRLPEIATEYLTAVRAEGRLSPCTLRNYTSGVRRLVAALPQETVLSDLTPEKMRAWFAKYATTHSPNSTRQQYSACAALFQYATAQDVLHFNPLARVKLPAKSNTYRESLSQSDAQKLLKATDLIVDPTKRLRAKAFFALLLFAGLRRSEANDLKLGDVFLPQARLEIRHGKGDKARTANIPPECVAALRDWLKVRPTTSKHDYVFCANGYDRMGRDTIHNMYQAVYHLAGIPLPQRPGHILRANYATRIILNGGTVYDVQAGLGHEDLNTSVIYLSKFTGSLEGREHLASFQPKPVQELYNASLEPSRSRRDARFQRRQVNRER